MVDKRVAGMKASDCEPTDLCRYWHVRACDHSSANLALPRAMRAFFSPDISSVGVIIDGFAAVRSTVVVATAPSTEAGCNGFAWLPYDTDSWCRTLASLVNRTRFPAARI